MSENRHADLLRQYLEEEARRPGTARPKPWAEWLRLTLGASVALGAALSLVDCGGTAEGGGGTGGTACPACTGGSGGVGGSDGGGMQAAYGIPYDAGEVTTGGTGGAVATGGTGGANPIGGTGGITVPYGIPFETNCTDGIDNDHNGLTDCADPYCAGTAACGTGGAGGAVATGGTGGTMPIGGTGGMTAAYGIPYETNCTDGIDNDGNGLTDCADPHCRTLPDCMVVYGIPF
jgi:hypothetical protein